MANKRKTREERIKEIHDAAFEVFASKGFHRTTMEDVIARTELSKGGFYYYYSSTKEIMIDMMRVGNLYYMEYNPFMRKLDQVETLAEKIDIAMEAFLEKSLVVTDARKVYTMFLHEVLYDREYWDVFIELETEFHKYILSKLGLSKKCMDDETFKANIIFISRLMNGMLFAQNMSLEPEVLLNKREEIKEMIYPFFKKMIIADCNM